MKYLILAIFLFLLTPYKERQRAHKREILKAALYDKIYGAWAGQLIGLSCNGIPAYASADSSNVMFYNAESLTQIITGSGGQLMTDIAYLNILDSLGQKTSSREIGLALVKSNLPLDHAMRCAKYNIQHKIMPPQSGYWINNPHADDIDFRNACDFIGLINPGLPERAASLSSRVGHISQSGDGYYAGLYVVTMYTLAFTENNIEQIVKKSLNTIPHRSEFYQCIESVIEWHRRSPKDMYKALGYINKRWFEELGCPDGVDDPASLEAKINTAYVVLALLYGEMDFNKTMQLANQTGLSAKENAASALGILTAFKGFSDIPENFKQDVLHVEGEAISNTGQTLKDIVAITFNQALQGIEESGGKIKGNTVLIDEQVPQVASFERCFAGHAPVSKQSYDAAIVDREFNFTFEGIGFVLRGEAVDNTNEPVLAELYLNNRYIETIHLPLSSEDMRRELAWKYELPHNQYAGKIKILKPANGKFLKIKDLIVYDVRTR